MKTESLFTSRISFELSPVHGTPEVNMNYKYYLRGTVE